MTLDEVTSTAEVPTAEVAGALASAPWDQIRRSLLRRDSSALRAHVEGVLWRYSTGRRAVTGDGDPDDDVEADRLRVWRRFSRAVFTGHVTPLQALVGADPVTPGDPVAWDDLVDRTLTYLCRDLPPRSDATAGPAYAAIAVFVYFECLVFWEHSNEYEPVDALIDAMVRFEADFVSVQPVPDGISARVVAGAAALTRSLRLQFGVEDGIGCCSPTAIARAAGESSVLLNRTADDLAVAWAMTAAPDGTDQVDDDLRPLVALLLVDIARTEPYYRLLRKDLAPAIDGFVQNLVTRGADDVAISGIDSAIRACRTFEDTTEGKEGVAGSEARAHRLVLDEARSVLAEDQPTLLVDHGEIVFLYPFGLPVAASGDDHVRRALRSHLEGSTDSQVGGVFELAGARVSLDDTPQTDGWVDSPASDQLDFVGVRLLFEDHELMLETADGVQYRDLGFEVRLGGLGNHYIRITVATDTKTSTDGGATWQVPDQPWTPHLIDQFIRRANTDVGDERVWLQRREGPEHTRARRSRAAVLHSPAEATRVIDLATRIVMDLVVYSHELERERTAVTDAATLADAPHDSEDVVAEFLRRHAHVLVTVDRATALRGGAAEPVPIERPADLPGVVGTNVLLTAQRPFPQSPTEWVRFPAQLGDDAPRVVGGRIRGELISCSGDTTLLFAPTLPNWQALETRELIEFSCSLTGVYSRRHNWLRLSLRNVDEQTAAASKAVTELSGRADDDQSEAETEELRSILTRMRTTEVRLDESLNHVEILLERARTFRLSRDQQSRELVQDLCARNGVFDLQEALTSSIHAAGAQQRLVRTRIERLASEVAKRDRDELEADRVKRERPVQVLLTALAVFGFIDLFWWFGDSWGMGGNHYLWIGEFVVLGIIAVTAVVFSRKSRDTS